MSNPSQRVAARFLERVADYTGNPNGKGIYPVKVEHGYGEPLAGGTDVMRKLQNRLLEEQGRPPRPESPRLAAAKHQTGVLREPYYKMGDGLVGLTDAARSEPQLREDTKLQKLIKDVAKAQTALHQHLEATYIWD